MAQPGLPARADRALPLRRQAFCWMLLLDVSQDLGELLDQPGMQHHIRSRQHAFGAQFASGGTEQSQHFGGTTTLVLMWLRSRMAFWFPRGPRLWNGLIGSSFVFIKLYDPVCFRVLTCQFDQSFFPVFPDHRLSPSRFCAYAGRSPCGTRCGCVDSYSLPHVTPRGSSR